MSGPRSNLAVLSQVREIAPEFYNHLPQCKSWPGIFFFISLNPHPGEMGTTKKGGLLPESQSQKMASTVL
jgi:hypothetical protein